jgi:hypothetical protein
VLAAAGVTFGLALPDQSKFLSLTLSPTANQGTVDSHVHNIPIEAGWAAKYAGLSSKEAVDLVSANIEKILGLDVKGKRDFVIYEGNPLEFGASVVLAFDGQDGLVSTCWPESN